MEVDSLAHKPSARAKEATEEEDLYLKMKEL